MSESEGESVSPMTATESESEDLIAEYEKLTSNRRTLYSSKTTWFSDSNSDQIALFQKLRDSVGELHEPTEVIVRLLENAERAANASLARKDGRIRELEEKLLALETDRDEALSEERGFRNQFELECAAKSAELGRLKRQLEMGQLDGVAKAQEEANQWKRQVEAARRDLIVVLELFSGDLSLAETRLANLQVGVVPVDAVRDSFLKYSKQRAGMEEEVVNLRHALKAKQGREVQLKEGLERMSEKYTRSVNELNGFREDLAIRYEKEAERSTEHQQQLKELISERDTAVKILKSELEQLHEQFQMCEEQLKTKAALIQSLTEEKGAVEQQLAESNGELVRLQSEMKAVDEDAGKKLEVVKSQLMDVQVAAEKEKAKIKSELEEEIQFAQEQAKVTINQLSVKMQENDGVYREQIKILKKEVFEYQKRISNLQSDLTSVQRQHEMTSENVLVHKRSIEKLELQLLDSGEKQRQLEEEIERRVENIQCLEKDLVSTTASSNELRSQTSEMRLMLERKESTLEAEKQQLKAELEMYKGRLVVVQSELSELETQHSTCKDEVGHREKIIEQLNGQYQRSEGEFISCKAQIFELEENLKETKAKEVASQTQILQAERLIKQLKEDLAELQAERERNRIEFFGSQSSLGQERDNLEKKHRACLHKMAEQEKMTEKLKQSSRILESKYKIASAEVDQRIEAIRRMEVDLEAGKQREEKLRQECRSWQNHVQTFRDELENIREKYRAAEEELDEEYQKSSALEEQLLTVKRSLEDVQQVNGCLSADLVNARGALETKGSEVDISSQSVLALKKQLKTLKAENESVLDELNDVRKENEDLSAELKERTQWIEAHQQDMLQKDSELVTLRVKGKALEEQAGRLNQKLNAKDSSICHTRQELEEKCSKSLDLQSDVRQLELKLWNAQEKLKAAEQDAEKSSRAVTALEEDLVKVKEEVEAANQHTSEVRQEMEKREITMANEREAWRKELDCRKNDLAQAKLELTTLQQQHSYCEEEIAHRETAIHHLESKYQQAQQEFFSCKMTVSDLNERLRAIREEKYTVELRISEFESAIKTLGEKMECLEAENQTAEEELNCKTNDVVRLEIGCRSLEEERNGCLERLACQEELVENLHQSKAMLEKKYELCLADLKQRVEFIHRLQIEVARFQEQGKCVEQEVTSVRSQCVDLQKELAVTQERLQKSKSKHFESTRVLETRLASVEREYHQTKEGSHLLKAQIREYKGEQERRKTNDQLAEQLRTHLEALQTLNESLSKEMECNRRRFDSLSVDLDEARKRVAMDRQEMANKDGQLVILRVTLKATKEECQNLNDELVTKDGMLVKMQSRLDDMSKENRDFQLKIHQLQQHLLAAEEKLRTSQHELQSVVDLVLNRPNGAQPAAGGMASNIIVWIKRLRHSTAMLKEENELKNRQIGVSLHEEISKLEAGYKREKQLVHRLHQQLEDQCEIRRQHEVQLASKSVTIERLQEQLCSHMQSIQQLNEQLGIVSKENVDQRILIDREKSTIRTLETECRRKNVSLSEMSRSNTSPDSGHCDWESADEALSAAARAEGLYAATLKKGLLLKQISKPVIEAPNGDANGDLLDSGQWIERSSKLSLQLQQSSLFYSQEDRRQALELELLRQEKLINGSVTGSSDSVVLENTNSADGSVDGGSDT
eukprot:m.24822 g.24822  ORF g.24822 m.24822 type:complete len:1664 (+) comp28681_c0_seq1:107-5098(+)